MHSISKLEKQKKIASSKNNLAEISQICNLLGREYEKIGNFSGALLEHEEELTICNTIHDKLGVAVANRRMGEILCVMNEWEKAIDHQKMYMTLAEELKNVTEVQRAYATIGRTYFEKACCEEVPINNKIEDLTSAERSFLKALQLCEKLADEVDSKELKQMRCRVYLNLGLVIREKGDLLKAEQFLFQALELCCNCDLLEDTYLCYFNLASLYVNCDKVNESKKYADKLLDISLKLKEKSLIYDTYCLLGQISVCSLDFTYAKKWYYKAYKRKFSKKSQEDTERKLKFTVLLLRGSNSLIEEDEYGEKAFRLYEKMGDYCAEMNCYYRSIDYYNKACDVGLKLEKSNKVMAPLYLSLGSTYYDVKQYNTAQVFYLREYNIQVEINQVEACKTLFYLAEIEEILNNKNNVLMYYEKATEICINTDNIALCKETLSRISSSSLLSSSEKRDLEKKIGDIPETEDSDENEEHRLASDEDVDLSLIEFSDSDEEAELLKTKANLLGETVLHRACIEGNLNHVKSLTKLGHSVNVRDNAGWLPIHEAANHGHLEIVEYLIESGALLNDRGGKACSGYTPLIDASYNGHLDVVQLLLSKGASVLARSDDGDTALDGLVKYRLSNPLSEIEEKICRDLENEMENIMSKLGHNDLVDDHKKYSVSAKSFESNIQKNTSCLLVDDENSSCDTDMASVLLNKASTTESYENVMKSLGSASKRHAANFTVRDTSVAKKSALIDENDYVADSWLVDDMKSNKKRKYFNDISLRSAVKKHADIRIKDNPIMNKSSLLDVQEYIVEDCLIDDIALKKKRKSFTSYETEISCVEQSKYIDTSNFTESKNKKLTQGKLDFFCESIASVKISEKNTSNSFLELTNIIKLKVHIKKHILLVPLSETNKLKPAQWLAEEVARRYFSLEGIKPNVKLTTLSDAEIDPNDPVVSVLTEDLQLKAVVLGWDLQPLSEKYVEVCQSLSSPVVAAVRDILQQCELSNCLNLEKCKTMRYYNNILPVLKAIHYQCSILYLNFSECKLGDDGFMTLLSGLKTLSSLRSLILRCCSITAESVDKFSISLRSKEIVLPLLIEIDLSYNNLLHLKTDTLITLLTIPTLTSLKLQNCMLLMTERSDLELNMFAVKELYLDCNIINPSILRTILSFVPKLEILSLSNFNINTECIERFRFADALAVIFEHGDFCTLTNLNISNTHFTDEMLMDISTYICHCSNISALDLSYNDNITSKSVCVLLKEMKHKLSLHKLCFHGIKDLFCCDEVIKHIVTLLQENSSLTYLSFTKTIKTELIDNLWLSLHSNNKIKVFVKEVFLSR